LAVEVVELTAEVAKSQLLVHRVVGACVGEVATLPAPAGKALTGPRDPRGHQRLSTVINGYLQEKGLSLRQGTIVDAAIIHALCSTKNEEGKRDPEMHQPKKGNQYYFGMKAHIGADAESGLVHHVHGTAANVAAVTQVAELLHGEENAVYADAG
jgi:IS5 family transposase